MRVATVLATVVALFALGGTTASGAGSAFRSVAVARGLGAPVLVAYAPGEPKSLYVVEQPGRVLRLLGGTRRVFLDIRNQVDYRGERGLLGLAFSPRYQRDHLFYVAYTTSTQNMVVRFRARAGKAIPSTQRVLLQVEDPYSNFVRPADGRPPHR